MKIPRISFVLALSGTLSCAHAAKDQTFSVAPEASPSQAIDRVLETLAHERLAAGTVDRSKGTVVTRWFDTGYRFREIDDDRPVDYYTDIFLRHRISVVPTGGKLDVTVSTDVQRCAPLDAVITATDVQGTCRPMTTVFPTQQNAIDRFVEDLRKAVSTRDHRS
jgi:hypothetical protein